MSLHEQSHELAGKTVLLKINGADPDGLNGKEYRIEDWWDRIAGKSWGICDGNPACMKYGIRAGFSGLPFGDEVVYGKVGPFGHLIHVSELGDVQP